jgi:hypothetical protein
MWARGLPYLFVTKSINMKNDQDKCYVRTAARPVQRSGEGAQSAFEEMRNRQLPTGPSPSTLPNGSANARPWNPRLVLPH